MKQIAAASEINELSSSAMWFHRFQFHNHHFTVEQVRRSLARERAAHKFIVAICSDSANVNLKLARRCCIITHKISNQKKIEISLGQALATWMIASSWSVISSDLTPTSLSQLHNWCGSIWPNDDGSYSRAHVAHKRAAAELRRTKKSQFLLSINPLCLWVYMSSSRVW